MNSELSDVQAGFRKVRGTRDQISIIFWITEKAKEFPKKQKSMWTSLVTQTVKTLPAMMETRVQSLSWADPLEKGIAIHYSILALRIPWTEKPGGLQFMESQRIGHDWVNNTFTFCFIDYVKAFECVDHNILRKIFKEMGIPVNLTCLRRNLYAGQEEIEPIM